jgi:hypothetical protein
MNLRTLFPKASKSFLDANPQPDGQPEAKNDATAILTPRRGRMNKTEGAFAMRLEAMRSKGEIMRWEFEGITLRWAGMRYTPDFVVFIRNRDYYVFIQDIKLIEIKGAHIWDRDLVRFKGAAAYWPEFEFEMWQKKSGEWKRIR